jgi:hypothetical protein
LETAFNYESSGCCILQSRREKVLSGITSGDSGAVETPSTPMNKGRLQNNEEFTSGNIIVARQEYIFRVSADADLMTHAKTIAFSTQDAFGVSPENKPAAGLRERNVKVRRQSAADWS